MNNAPYEEVAKLLEYNPETGDLIWRGGPNRKAGKVAGCARTTHGYRLISINGVSTGAHRIAWLLYYGEWPDRPIDHINRDRLDNRICNLRKANLSQNTFNACIRSNNKSGHPGVYWDAKIKRWRVQIRRDGRTVHIGVYHDRLEAIAARIAAEQSHPDAQFMPSQNVLKGAQYA